MIKIFFRKLFGMKCVAHEPANGRLQPSCKNCGEKNLQAYLLENGWFWRDGQWIKLKSLTRPKTDLV